MYPWPWLHWCCKWDLRRCSWNSKPSRGKCNGKMAAFPNSKVLSQCSTRSFKMLWGLALIHKTVIEIYATWTLAPVLFELPTWWNVVNHSLLGRNKEPAHASTIHHAPCYMFESALKFNCNGKDCKSMDIYDNIWKLLQTSSFPSLPDCIKYTACWMKK